MKKVYTFFTMFLMGCVMENINDILERQCVSIEFKDGKVKYFSISTQWGEADTIEEAVKDIIESDKVLNGKSVLGYVIEDLL